MERNLLVAGFGGQGIMMLGKLLAHTACEYTDKKVTFFPSYGAEMRGGTANCYVVISDDPIGTPLGDSMDDLIVMNSPSLNKFLCKLKKGGNLFINGSIVKDEIQRNDVTVISAPVTEMALEIGNAKVLNVIMLGVYVGFSQVVSEEAVLDGIIKQLGKKTSMISINEKAFESGLAIGRAARKAI
jgi:2-oxoglutarate ferredoxin oxidoreductase subunit gamma